MNGRFIGVLCFLLLACSSTPVMAADVLSEVSEHHLPVPQLVKAKLSGKGIQGKLIISLPFYHDSKFEGFRPRLFSAERFKFYDADGKPLDFDAVAKLTPKVTAIYLVDGYTGSFEKDIAGVKQTALLASGGKVDVIDATASASDKGSGDPIATVNGVGLDKTYPSCHAGQNVYGWLGRNDINKGHDDPDRFGWLHYDLGVAQQLVGLRIWNYNSLQLIQRGVRDIDVYVSNDAKALGENGHASWQRVTELVDIPQGPGHQSKRPYGSDYTIKSISARFIRLDIQRNWGNGWNTALAEVQFFAVPDERIYAVTADVVNAQRKP